VPFDDIYAVTERLGPATPEQVKAIEAAIGTKFPPGYAEFVTRFGDGSISNWVRVYPPDRVAEEALGHRERREEYYFWDDGADVLTREQVTRSVLLADTYNGDEVVYHPNEPVGLFVLPNDDGVIYPVGGTLEEAIDWICTSGTLTAPVTFKWFEPASGRVRRRFEAEADGPSFEAVRDALVALGLHDRAEDATEGEDKCFDLFVREFGGVVTIVEGECGAVVGLRTDTEADGPQLERVVATLHGLGLTESAGEG
jgi:hypothetical protein